MYFNIIDTENLKIKNIRYHMLRKAKENLAFYTWNTDDYKLNEYCINHYKKSLYHLCLELLEQLDFIDMFGHIIIKPKTQEVNRIIQLITYGTDQLKGSLIFKNILEGSAYVL